MPNALYNIAMKAMILSELPSAISAVFASCLMNTKKKTWFLVTEADFSLLETSTIERNARGADRVSFLR